MNNLHAATDGDLSQIWTKWIAFWNGSLADELIAEDYTLHMSPIVGGDLSGYAGPAGLASWIGGLHATIDKLVFAEQVKPLFGEGMIAGRWIVTGSYKGGFPGAQAEPGTAIKFAGADFLRIENSKIAEYWLSADVLDLLTQLKMMD